MYGAILDGYAAVIGDKGKVIRKRVGRRGARSVQVNISYIAVLYSNGKVRFYRTRTGTDIGQIGDTDAINIQLRGKRIAITYKNGDVLFYNLVNRARVLARQRPPRKGGIYESVQARLKALAEADSLSG